MALIFKDLTDIQEFFAAAAGGSETLYSWFVDHTPSLWLWPQNVESNIGLQVSQSGSDARASIQTATAVQVIGIVSPPAVAGTPLRMCSRWTSGRS